MDLRVLRLGLLCAGLLGCVGGQSGTESGGGQKSIPDTTIATDAAATGCACALSDRPGAAARGTVVEVDGSRVRVRVSELLGEGPVEPMLRFAVGDEIGGASPQQICSDGPALQPGEDVALVHVPGDDTGYACLEYQTCVLDRCAELPAGDVRYPTCDQDCMVRTRGQCAMHAGEALLNGTLLAAPWADELVLPGDAERPGSSVRLPRAQLPTLLDGPACNAWLHDQTDAGPKLGND